MIRTFHLGLDYGTSASKLVLRDYHKSGEERAFLVPATEGFRFSSSASWDGEIIRICEPRGPREDSRSWYESIKMRVASEIDPSKKYCYADIIEWPRGLRARDLAVLTNWLLLSQGRRFAEELVRSQTGRSPDPEEVVMGATMGIPMSFYCDDALREEFLFIARSAWELYRVRGVRTSTSFAIEEAKQFLEEAYGMVQRGGPVDHVADWIRSEAEAAIFRVFKSPETPAGTYAEVDVGAGTTNVSMFRIVPEREGMKWVKNRLTFFAADSGAVGMDAVDEELAELLGNAVAPHSLRSKEPGLLRDDALVKGCQNVFASLKMPFLSAWHRAFEKRKGMHQECEEWRNCRVLALGGGGQVEAIRSLFQQHPQNNSVTFDVIQLNRPTDFVAPSSVIPARELPFVMVAYGLSHQRGDLPPALLPQQVEPADPDRPPKRPPDEWPDW